MSASNHTGRVTPPTVPQHVKNAEAQQIADDIAAFRKRGGKIEKLGNTPLRGLTPYSSRKQRRPLEKGNK